MQCGVTRGALTGHVGAAGAHSPWLAQRRCQVPPRPHVDRGSHLCGEGGGGVDAQSCRRGHAPPRCPATCCAHLSAASKAARGEIDDAALIAAARAVAASTAQLVTATRAKSEPGTPLRAVLRLRLADPVPRCTDATGAGSSRRRGDACDEGACGCGYVLLLCVRRER